MATRYNSNYVNPTFKSDIFNTSYDAPRTQASAQNQKTDLNSSWSHDNFNSRPARGHTSQRDDYSICSSQNSARNTSYQGSRHHNSEQEVRGQFNRRKIDLEEQPQTNYKAQYESTMKVSKATRKEIEAALFEKEQMVKDQNNYKRELDRQVREKSRKRQTEQIVDFNCINSGLPVGEIHGGFDVEEYARMLRVKENKKVFARSREREADADHECSSDSSFSHSRNSRSCNSRHYGKNPASHLHDRKVLDPTYFDKVDEESDSQSQDEDEGDKRGTKTWSALQKKKADKKDPSQYLQAPPDSKYHVQKICQQKLKNHLKNQAKKYEEYTAKLIEDQKKRKQNWMQVLEGQMASEAQRKKPVFKNDQQSKNSSGQKSSSNQKATGTASRVNQSLLNQIAEKYSGEKDVNQEKASTRKREGRDGRCQRLLEDTVKQLLHKRAKYE